MKLHLPVSLCRALAVLFASAAYAAETVVINDMTPSMGDVYDRSVYYAENCNLELKGDWQPEHYDEDGYRYFTDIEWHVENGDYTLSGSGALGDMRNSWDDDWVFFSIFGNSNSKVTIEKDINLKNVALYIGEGSDVIVNGSITGLSSSIDVGMGATLDLTKASISSSYLDWGMETGSTLRVKNLSITPSTFLDVWGNYPDDNIVYLDGNLTLKGTSFNISRETRYTEPDRYGSIYIQGNQTTLSVSGTISIEGKTTIVYYHADSNGTHFYGNPDLETPLFICTSINEDKLKLLEAYVVKYDGYEVWYKPLLDADTFYYAVTGNDNLVYVYLGDGSITAGPDENDIVVGEGQEIVLGSGAAVPSDENLVWINGGTADASGLVDELLSNEIILSQGGGTLKTDSNQTMSLVGKGSVNYSIVSATAGQAAAKLEIGKAGSTDVLKLNGEKYESAVVNVNSGTVVIGGDTTVGLGAGRTDMTLAADTKLSNEGTVAADITSKAGSTVTNLGSITGDVVLESGSALNNNTGSSITGDVELRQGALLTNNGTLEGALTAEGKVTGSGTFADTTLYSTAVLHVGNSPGYQKHTSLTLERGATLSFSVDGITPASLTNYGNGTHSFLEAESLTINPGTGAVTVKVDVTMGILSAGTEPMNLTLMEVGTATTATTADFTLALQDNSGLLEEGSTISFEDGKLKFNAAVSKAALAALMDSNSANVANTMWASANAVQEMVRTAENQFLVGMPGQTTFWGAGLGSFMDVGGKQGFSSHAGGYAVGMQHAFTEKFRAGFAFGQMFGNFQSDDNQLKADQKALVPMLTAQYVTKTGKMSSVTVSGHVAYGMVENEADTYQAATAGHAKWDDEVLNIGARVAWNVNLGDHVTVSFFTGLNYQSVDQDSFTETFTGGEREYRDGSMSSLSVPLGITLRGIYEMEGTNIFAPELTLAYIGDVARDNPEVRTSVYGFNRVGKGTDLGRSAFTLSVGANWMFDSNWSIGAFYTLEARDEQLNQSLNAALRYSF